MDARKLAFENSLNKAGAVREERLNETENGLAEVAEMSAEALAVLDEVMAAVCELAELIDAEV